MPDLTAETDGLVFVDVAWIPRLDVASAFCLRLLISRRCEGHADLGMGQGVVS